MTQWNRATRRKMARYGIGQEMLKKEVETRMDWQRNADYKFAWAAAMVAFHEATGWDKNRLQHLAERIVEVRNNAMCAEELVQELKDKTGFDVNQKPSEYVYDE